jgi:hypothetical protein
MAEAAQMRAASQPKKVHPRKIGRQPDGGRVRVAALVGDDAGRSQVKMLISANPRGAASRSRPTAGAAASSAGVSSAVARRSVMIIGGECWWV